MENRDVFLLFFYICIESLYCHSYSAPASELASSCISSFLCMLLHAQIIIVQRLHKSMPLVIQYQRKKKKKIQILTHKISWISVTKWKISLLNGNQWNINQLRPWLVAEW